MKPPVGGRSERVSLSLTDARLRRGARDIPLRPKDFAILQLLIAHRGRLVARKALLAAAWPDVFVSDAVLKVAINRLRTALGDNARAPRFIETRHRRGYCLVGNISLVDAPALEAAEAAAVPRLPEARAIVGREAERAQLEEWFAHAAGGSRQLVFVTGEAGLGKTALVDLLLESPNVRGVRVGRGQCVEQHGAGEAYLPVFDALARLCRGPGGRTVTRLLARHAPSWLVQMPGLLGPKDTEVLRQQSIGVTRERRLRELVETIDVLAREHPLILVVEDLHWSDPSTLDALGALARRRDRARLFVLATYRPEETPPPENALPALIEELRLHHLCAELSLPLLSESAVHAYLDAKYPGATQAAELSRAVYRRTEGHPLFLVAMLDHLVASEWLVPSGGGWDVRVGPDVIEREVPSGIRQLIEARLDRLAVPERRLLEAASVAGADWSAASTAAALDEAVAAVDERCAALARRRMLVRAGGEETWPDGTTAGRYGFSHALYREVIYDQVPAASRQDFHRRVAMREEAAYGAQASRIAARLAVHFEKARDSEAAVRYRLHAARNALAVSGCTEAIHHATAGLAMLPHMPDDHERHEHELSLQLMLGMATAAAHGFAAAEAERAYGRAWDLCGGVGNTPASTAALVGLYAYHLMRGRITRARGFAEQILDGAPRDGAAPPPILWGRMSLGITQMHQGESSDARASFENALALHDARQRAAYAVIHPLDLAMVCLVHLSWCLWVLGYPTQALARSRAAIAVADETGQPVDRACAIAFASFLHAFRRDAKRARDSAAAAVRLSAEHGLLQWWAPSMITHGWARAALGEAAEGIAEMRQGIEAWRGAGADYAVPVYLAMLGDALGRHGEREQAREVLTEALHLTHTNGDQFWEPEIQRLRGEIILQDFEHASSNASRQTLEEAAEAIERALDLAHAQRARGLELRAATSWCRLERLRGHDEQARARLAEIYDSFGEGFQTRDLRDARAALAGGEE